MRAILVSSLFFFSLLLPLFLLAQEKRPSEHFSEAYALYTHGHHSQAEELFRKTLGSEFLLEDYSLYFLGTISLERNDASRARNYFARLKNHFLRSVWSTPAELRLAKLSLKEQNYDQAIERLRALRARKTVQEEVSDEALFLLGRIHEIRTDSNRAYSLYQELRQVSPLSPWATKARKAVKKLRKEHPQLFGLKTPQALSAEGDMLLRERTYREAEKVYHRLLDLVPKGKLRPSFLLGLARIYRNTRKKRKAIPLLSEIVEKYPRTSEAPMALFRLAQISWNRDENIKALDYFRQLMKRYPRTVYRGIANFASARIYESLSQPREALRIYQNLSKRFPHSRFGRRALWRLAWMHYLRDDYRSAYSTWKRLAAAKGGKRYQTAALYWQGRAAEKIGRTGEAKRIFLQILNEEDEGYYTGRATKRLARLGESVERKRTTGPIPTPEAAFTPRPHVSFHLSRAQALTQLALKQLAVTELDQIRNLKSNDLPLKIILMQEYARNEAFDRSVPLANQMQRFSATVDGFRYPLAYWETIQKVAKDKKLDPYLILALIRQESLFDPKALSPAAAYGLMQLLPSTAARTAAQLGLTAPSPNKLFEPNLNLMLGICHLKELLQRYSNNLVKAIAAYNAGKQAVARWEKQIIVNDDEEFIERIPYGETRLYLKLVLRNHWNYTRIYNSEK